MLPPRFGATPLRVGSSRMFLAAGNGASGVEAHARAAGFSAPKSLEDFSFDHQSGLERDTVAHLANWGVPDRRVQHRPARPARNRETHLATGLGLRGKARPGVLFATAIDWVVRLQAARTRTGVYRRSSSSCVALD